MTASKAFTLVVVAFVSVTVSPAGESVPKPTNAQTGEQQAAPIRVSIHYLDGLSSKSGEQPREIRFLNNGCRLSLLLTNTSKSTLHLWEPYCPEGDSAIRLEFKRDKKSQTIGVARTSHKYSGGMGIPKTFELVPDDSLVYQIDFSKYWSLPFVLKPGEQCTLLVRAVYESTPSTQAQPRLTPNAGKVWIGKYETEWEPVRIANVTNTTVPEERSGTNILN